MPEADRLPLPRTTRELVVRTEVGDRHPGLQLDKYLPSLEDPQDGNPARGFQEIQKRALAEVCKTRGQQSLLSALLDRRRRLLDTLSAVAWSCRTTGPLTLHLARTSALENAGICLHPIYGFTYLPGSGLKGMARAFAETVWLPVQADQGLAWRRVEDVFGWAPDPERRKRILNPDHPAGRRREDDEDPESVEIAASAGAVVFHDAWPERWARLRLDIVNNHHRGYYEGKDDPGDWEEPTIVSFLSVGDAEMFSFALSKRHPDVDDDFVRTAREWLTGALTHLGAGAKTAAGYGGFRPDAAEAGALASPVLRSFETQLELVTPAFLAGASQTADDCELRPATLRGLLRWWWRTMHVGYVERSTLRRLEAAVWGDTEAGSPVRVVMESVAMMEPRRYEFKDRSGVSPQFGSRNELQPPGAAKTTQGLFYISYGMGEKGRCFQPAGAKWVVRLTARRSHFRIGDAKGGKPASRPLAGDLVLSQATAALWLLGRFGGVGSKGRKGFGAFADVPVEGIGGLSDCRQLAAGFRRECGLGNPRFDQGRAESASLEQVLGPIEVRTPWTNHWFALDQLGYAAQAFAKLHKHKQEKRAIGLPRRIGAPRAATMLVAAGGKGVRHASPVLCHLAKDASGRLTVRVLAFPARYLPPVGEHPDAAANTEFLRTLLEHLERDLDGRARQYDDKGRTPPYDGVAEVAGTAGGRTSSAPPAARPRSGDVVQAVLLPEKTRKGGWRARHEATGLSGEIQNTEAVPADKKAGDAVMLKVAAVHPMSIAFRWPGSEETTAAPKPPRGWRPGSGRGPHGR